MALIRYGMSHQRKKQKDQEFEDKQRIMSSGRKKKETFSVLVPVYFLKKYFNRKKNILNFNCFIINFKFNFFLNV